ncbi:hypothetical protein D9M68_19540 [compost metagenome]
MQRLMLAASKYAQNNIQLPGPLDYDVSKWQMEISNIKAIVSTADCESIIRADGKYAIGCTSGKLAHGISLGNLSLANSAAVVGSAAITRLAYGNGIFVAGTSNGQIYTSTDLQTWVKNVQAGGFLGTVVNSIKFINGEFVATGGGATGCKSTDGLNWTNISANLNPLYNATNAQVAGLLWDGNQYVACSGNKRIGYSASLDVPFTSVTVPSTATNFNDIAFNGSTYMAVGTSGVIVTSQDLINWVQDTSMTAYIGSSDFFGVLWDGFKWFVYGENGKSMSKYPAGSWVANNELNSFLGTRDINHAYMDTDRIIVVTEDYGIYSTLPSPIPPLTPSKHYRIIIATVGSGAYAQMSEVELLDSNGIDLLDPATTITNQSSAYGGATFLANRLVDNDPSTKWTSNGIVANEWVTFELPTEATPVSLTMKEGANESYRMPMNFQIQTSQDGIVWTTVKYVSGQSAWGNGEKRTYTLS